MTFNDFKIQVRNSIKDVNFVQSDPRFNRSTWTVVGQSLKIPKEVLEYLNTKVPISKYRDDWTRMKPYFDAVISETKLNPDSRRLVVLNTDNYLSVQPCFLTLQFLKDNNGLFNVLVYQRSGDVEKLEDDLIFFSYIMRKFENQTGKKCDKLTVVYGSLHYTKE